MYAKRLAKAGLGPGLDPTATHTRVRGHTRPLLQTGMALVLLAVLATLRTLTPTPPGPGYPLPSAASSYAHGPSEGYWHGSHPYNGSSSTLYPSYPPYMHGQAWVGDGAASLHLQPPMALRPLHHLHAPACDCVHPWFCADTYRGRGSWRAYRARPFSHSVSGVGLLAACRPPDTCVCSQW